MLAQGNNPRLRDQGGSRGSSRTQDQKTRTVSTCWSNPGGISLILAARFAFQFSSTVTSLILPSGESGITLPLPLLLLFLRNQKMSLLPTQNSQKKCLFCPPSCCSLPLRNPARCRPLKITLTPLKFSGISLVTPQSDIPFFLFWGSVFSKNHRRAYSLKFLNMFGYSNLALGAVVAWMPNKFDPLQLRLEGPIRANRFADSRGSPDSHEQYQVPELNRLNHSRESPQFALRTTRPSKQLQFHSQCCVGINAVV